MAMITLTDEEADAIPDPETALENARRALRGEVI